MIRRRTHRSPVFDWMEERVFLSGLATPTLHDVPPLIATRAQDRDPVVLSGTAKGTYSSRRAPGAPLNFTAAGAITPIGRVSLKGSIEVNAQSPTGRLTISTGHGKLFAELSALEPSDAYLVTITGGTKRWTGVSSSGEAIVRVVQSRGRGPVHGRLTITFQALTSDLAPPTVTAESPAAGAAGLAVTTTVSAIFNESVQASSIHFALTDTSGSSVPANLIYVSSTDTATLVPSSALAYNTTYAATISGAVDAAGDPMRGPVTWSFTTGPPPTGLTVMAETPEPGATGVPVSTAIYGILPLTATFNQPVQFSTISFTLTSSSGSVVPTTVWYSDVTYTATMTPLATLANSTTYTATISGAKNNHGVAMSAPVTWSFITTAASATMPTVMSTSPPANASSVDISTPIAVNFNEAVLGSSISSANFKLTTASGTVVPSTIAYTVTGALNTATLTPIAALAYSTMYTATISGVKDANGHTMAGSYTWSFTTDSGSSTYTQLPLLYQSNLQYVGAFRVPNFYNSVSQTSYAGQGLAYDAADNSLFMAGYFSDDSVIQISIPSSIVNSTNLDSLATDSDLSNFARVNSLVPDNTANVENGGGALLGGLVVDNGELIGTEYGYYDTTGATYETHFVLNTLNLATAQGEGMFEVGGITLDDGTVQPGGAAGFYDGYMAPIPAAWQSALGAPYLTGNGALSIISRTSSGPALFGFNPSAFNTSTPTTPTPYVYFPLSNPLGTQDSYDPLYDGNTNLNGVFFAPGSSSVLVFGSVGTNQVQYGEPSASNDPYRAGKGFHALDGDYAYQVWAYNANDFLSVMDGKLQPWQVQPYATWNLDFPQFNGGKTIGGVTFDPTTNQLFVEEQGADTEAPGSWLPVIQVYQLTLNSAGSGESANAVTAASGVSSRMRVAAATMTSASTTTNAMAVTADSGTTSGSQHTLLGTVPDFDANQTGSGAVLTGSAALPQQGQPVPSGPRFAIKAKAVNPPQKAAAQTPIVLRRIVVNDRGPAHPLLGSHDKNGE